MKENIKKKVVIVMAIFTVLSLCACGSKKTSDSQNNNDEIVSQKEEDLLQEDKVKENKTNNDKVNNDKVNNDKNADDNEVEKKEDSEQDKYVEDNEKNQNNKSEISDIQDVEINEASNSGGIFGVNVDFAEEKYKDFPDFDVYSISDSDYSERVMFYVDNEIKNFKVLSLTLDDIDDDGTVTFKTEELYKLDKISPDYPLVVSMEFMGTIPNNGISFEDENGVTRNFAVDISGMDGSVYLWEF